MPAPDPAASPAVPAVVESETSAPRTLGEVAAIPLMVLAGMAIAIQSQVVGDLADGLGEGPRASAAAAVISFGSGLLLLCLVVAVVPGPRAGVARLVAAARSSRLRPHTLLGGAGGALLVASQGLTVGTIGVALFVVAVVAGQTSGGLVVDRLGLGPSGRQPVSAGRLLGAGVTLTAVVISVSGRFSGGELAAGAVALALLPLAAGGANLWQQAMNGRVSAQSHPLAAALNNFVVGMALLTVFLLVSLLLPGDLTGPPSEWWLYLGGAIGVVFITAGAALVKVHGALVLGLCVIAGQVVASVLIDAWISDAPLGVATVVGAGVALVGVAIGTLATRR